MVTFSSLGFHSDYPSQAPTVPLVSQGNGGAPSHLNQPPLGAAGGASLGSPHTRRRSRAGRRLTPPHAAARVQVAALDANPGYLRVPRAGSSRGRRLASGKEGGRAGAQGSPGLCALGLGRRPQAGAPCATGSESRPWRWPGAGGVHHRIRLNPGPTPWRVVGGAPHPPGACEERPQGRRRAYHKKVKRLGDRAR